MRSVRVLVLTSYLAVAALTGAAPAEAAEVRVDRAQKHQSIDGFGFFGAHDVWWGSASSVVDDEWVRLVIEDLGLSIWRNEYYPPSDSMDTQDADWNKQRPVAEAFRRQAAESGVPLKTILTVWSPPAAMKCLLDDAGVHDGIPHPGGTKDGGALCPSRRDDFAQWLIEGLDLYAAIGMEAYALSFQNEPYFQQAYNSCFYAQDGYAETLAYIGPSVRAAYPDIKLFGAENMLAIECGRNGDEFDPWWYTANIQSRESALAQMDIWAVHGYSDGVTATESSRMSTLWTSFREGVISTSRPVWMTETSGYADTWEKAPDDTQGAMDLAQAIYAGLRYGDMAAWVWWQGSELGASAPSEYALMRGTEYRGKRYYVSKNYYRYIRPGAQRVAASSDDPDVLVVAFEHQGLGSFTLVAINAAHDARTLTLTGTDVPSVLELHRSSASEDCADLGTVSADSIPLPARSVTTLTAGSYHDDEPSSGTGGASSTGGAAGTAGSPGTGGAPSTGGAAGAAGSPGTGGAPSTGGTAGAAGSPGTGGAAAASGVGGGSSEPVSGGTGGASAAGGASGVTGSGGAPESGGTQGATPATGGWPGASGGTAGADGGATDPASEDEQSGGCGCRLADPVSGRGLGAGLVALLGLLVARRRQRLPRRMVRDLPGVPFRLCVPVIGRRVHEPSRQPGSGANCGPVGCGVSR